MFDFVGFTYTFEEEIERVLGLESATSTRVAERFVTPSELASLVRANFLDQGAVPRIVLIK